jgi:16S rRNA (guanine(966)-N(2))-methyltransferase RsmD
MRIRHDARDAGGSRPRRGGGAVSVRVIAGTAKGRRLAVPEVPGLRPTGDRARETLFNVLAPRLPGAIFLDAFAGSGAAGIEALSRGAVEAVFVEQSRRAAAVIADNLELCGLRERAVVLCAPWRRACARLAREGRRFDIAFFDPPYDRPDPQRCLQDLALAGLLADGGLAILEHRSRAEIVTPAGWQALRRIEVGEPSFSFFGILAGP